MLASCMHQHPPWHFLSLQPNCKQPICTHQRWKLSQQQECYSAQQPACLKWALPSKQSCFLSDCVDSRWLSGYIIFFGHYTLSSCNSTQRFADTRHERRSIAGVWTPQLSLHLNAKDPSFMLHFHSSFCAICRIVGLDGEPSLLGFTTSEKSL